MTNAFDARRAVLRRRLQAQRQVLGSLVSTDARDSNYPRSLTMSLLRGRASVAGWALRELVPLLVLHFLGKSGSSLLQALQSDRGSTPARDVTRRN
jgi:hypothetical protein